MSSIVLYGPPGSGKTTLAASIIEGGYRCIWIDFDKKVKLMKNLSHYLKEGKIEVREPESKLIEESFGQRMKLGVKKALIKQPKGFLEFADMMNALEEDPPKDASKCVIVLDSLTRVQEHYRRFLLHSQGKTHMVFEDWGFTLSMFEELFHHLFGLQPELYAHVICICHDQIERNELTGEIKIIPLLDGSMKHKIGQYVEEEYYTFVEISKDGEAEYGFMTKPVGKTGQARTSRELETWEYQSLGEIYKRGKE